MSGIDADERRRHRDAVHVVAPDDAAQLLGDQDQAVGEQHLVEVVAPVEPADQQPLEQHADRDREHDAGGNREPQAAEALGERPREVGADHVEAAVREVDDPHDAEDQRQPARDQEQQQSVLDAVQQLDQRACRDPSRVGSVEAGATKGPPAGGPADVAGAGRPVPLRLPAAASAAHLAAVGGRVVERRRRHAGHLVLLARHLAQVHVLHRVVRLRHRPLAARAVDRAPSPSAAMMLLLLRRCRPSTAFRPATNSCPAS